MTSNYGARIIFVRVLTLLLCALAPLAQAQEDKSLLEGLYRMDQAQRGADSYAENCASCHALDLQGNSNSPALAGVGFIFLWEGRSLAELFTQMRENMPTDRPGALATRTYLDLLAFILSRNAFPSGETAMTEAIANSPLKIMAPP